MEPIGKCYTSEVSAILCVCVCADQFSNTH